MAGRGPPQGYRPSNADPSRDWDRKRDSYRDDYHPPRDGRNPMAYGDGDSYRPRREPPGYDPYYERKGGDSVDYRQQYPSRPGPPGHDSYQPVRGRPDWDRPPQSDFTFRSEVQAPRFPARDFRREGDNYRPRPPTGPRNRDRDRNRNYQNGPRFRRRGPPPAHSRDILGAQREPTPDQLEGMTKGHNHFMDVDDASDDSEMSISESDGGESDVGSGNEQPRKKARVHPGADDADSKPKWSNPDPYTALPPPDESQTKKKDVLKMIRKAKATRDAEDHVSNAVTTNADFISFNDFEANDDGNESEHQTSTGPSNDHHPSTSTAAPHTPNNAPEQLLGRTSFIKRPPLALGSAPLESGDLNTDGSWNDPPAKINSTGVDIIENLSPPPVNSKKRKRSEPIQGGIVQAWQAREGQDKTPWIITDKSFCEHMGDWLHQEICEFYEFLRPQSFEQIVRQNLIDRLALASSSTFSGSTLECFGSFASGVYLPTSDLDLVVISESYRNGSRPILASNMSLKKLNRSIVDRRIAEYPTEMVFGAKVPIIKMKDTLTGLKVDISFENMTGIVANKTFKEWENEFPEMVPLVTLIKQLLAMRDLNEVFTGGIGGFSVTCLVVSFLQHLPEMHGPNKYRQHNMGDLLMRFLDFYGNKFDRSRVAIQTNPPGYRPKLPNTNDRISIIDPNDSKNDISKGSHNIGVVMKAFSQTFLDLSSRMKQLAQLKPIERRGMSILGISWGGNYSGVMRQRKKLREVYDTRLAEARNGPPSIRLTYSGQRTTRDNLVTPLVIQGMKDFGPNKLSDKRTNSLRQEYPFLQGVPQHLKESQFLQIRKMAEDHLERQLSNPS